MKIGMMGMMVITVRVVITVKVMAVVTVSTECF